MASESGKCVYVLHGQDDYLRRLHRRQILDDLLGGEQAALGVTELDGSAELSAVLDELRTAPFLAPRRVVVISEADKFVTTHAQALARYVANPSSTGTLILNVNSWPPHLSSAKDEDEEAPEPRASAKKSRDARKSALSELTAAVKSAGELVDCSAPEGPELAKWVAKLAQQRGKKMSPRAASLVAAWVGGSLGEVDSEIEKLSLFVGERAMISDEDVSAVVTGSAGPNPWALTGAIGRGETKPALEALDAMLTSRGEEFRLLGLLAWFLRDQAAKAGGGGKSFGSRSTPAYSSTMPAVQPQGAQSPAARRASRKLRMDFRRVLSADLAIKTGAEPVSTLQLLVTELCRK